MKVIKDGTKNVRISCPECNSELEYEQEDINLEIYDDCSEVVNERHIGMFGKEYWSTLYRYTKYYITCPICGKCIVVKTDRKSIGKKILDKSELTSW
jgi:ssDNA-binding Zn-finger/Zn-ribbon topoisomerase 1